MLLALDIGHTIAILEIDEEGFMQVVGAITFMYTKNNGIVLFFEVHDVFRRSSFGTYLIHLMGSTISYRSGKDHAAIYLMANQGLEFGFYVILYQAWISDIC